MSRSSEQRMTRSQVFAELIARGVDAAVVEFSGGNDEGGADSITLYRGDEPTCALLAWPEAGGNASVDEADGRLGDALSHPIFEAYGSFAGDFDVTGEVVWDVERRTVAMIRDERSQNGHFEDYL